MDQDQAQAFGEHLRATREVAGVTVRGLAERLGIDETKLIRMEQGTIASPRADLLGRIAD